MYVYSHALLPHGIIIIYLSSIYIYYAKPAEHLKKDIKAQNTQAQVVHKLFNTIKFSYNKISSTIARTQM